jgi:hypothetical protein
MKDQYRDVRKIEDALVRHHRSTGPPEASPLLVPRIMAHVREDWEKRRAGLFDGAHARKIVWRFTLAASLVAVLLGAVGMSLDAQTQIQFADIMMDDAQGLEWAQEFGLL